MLATLAIIAIICLALRVAVVRATPYLEARTSFPRRFVAMFRDIDYLNPYTLLIYGMSAVAGVIIARLLMLVIG